MLYDYKCTLCEHIDEVMVDVDSIDLRKCPKCGEKRFKRQISAGLGTIFRGQGWPGKDLYGDNFYKK